MKGNSLQEFMDDLLTMGGPEKEFTFHGKTYFLETLLDPSSDLLDMSVDEYIDMKTQDDTGRYIDLASYHFTGKTQKECVEKFQNAPIFDGKTIFDAESEIEVLFG